MAITNEATSFNGVVNASGTITAAHTPTGTPNGAFVWVMSVSSSATVSGVTYGGVSMTEVTGSPVSLSNGYIQCFSLVSGVPSGAQNAVATLVGTSTRAIYCLTLTGASALVVEDIDIINTTSSNPRGTLTLGGNTCFCATGLYDDQSSPASQTPLTNWTKDQSYSHGSKSSSFLTYDLISTADVTTGWDAGDVDNGAVSLAIRESVASLAITDATGVTSTNGDGTFDLPDVSAYTSDTVGCPFTSSSHSVNFELGDGTDTATLAGTYNPKSGWAVQEITSAVKTTGSVFENFVGTITDASQVYYPTASNTSVSATGIIQTDSTIDINMQFWDVSDETWKPFTVLIGSGDGMVSSLVGSMVTSMVASQVG